MVVEKFRPITSFSLLCCSARLTCVFSKGVNLHDVRIVGEKRKKRRELLV